MEKGLHEKTGKFLDEWIEIVKSAKIEKHSEIIKYLKAEHQFTHGYANFVALKTRKSDAASYEANSLLDMQYSRGKEPLRRIYEKLQDEIERFGEDIEFVPKKANVSVRRKKQFALIQPSTRSRVDIGLKLNGQKKTDRLKDSGPFGSMCTHHVSLTNVNEIDNELLSWLKASYDRAG